MNTVIATIQSGIPIARIELLDEVQIDAINRYSKTRPAGRAHPVPGVPRHARPAVPEQAEKVRRICRRASAAARSAGRPGRRTAPSCGRRATTPPMLAKALRPGASCGRPTCACRSRGWPNASSRPRRDIGRARPDRAHRRPCRRRQLPPGLLCSIPTIPAEMRARRRAQRPAGPARPGAWTAPAPASTASAWARWSSSCGAWRGGCGDAPAQEGARPAQHHEPGQDLQPVAVTLTGPTARPAGPPGRGPAGRTAARTRRVRRGAPCRRR